MANILITNDDGIRSPALRELAGALQSLGKVAILAPDQNWSASGHVKTLHKPLRAWEVTLSDGLQAIASDGAPSDCVALALLGYIPGPMDLVVAGINIGANFGYDLTYSGTVTAAMEAVIGGVPGIAISLAAESEPESAEAYRAAAQIALRAASEVLAHGLPPGTLLNINVPAIAPSAIRGVRITKQGTRVYRDELIRRFDPRGKPYYWIGGKPPTGVLEEGSDFSAVAEGWISITPIQLNLTATSMLEPLTKWNWSIG